MAETPLEMAKRHLRESEELLDMRRRTITILEHTGDQSALESARARLHFLEALRDAYRALLQAERDGSR